MVGQVLPKDLQSFLKARRRLLSVPDGNYDVLVKIYQGPPLCVNTCIT